MKTELSLEVAAELVSLTVTTRRLFKKSAESYNWIIAIGKELGIHPGDPLEGESDHEGIERFTKDIIKFIKAQEN